MLSFDIRSLNAAPSGPSTIFAADDPVFEGRTRSRRRSVSGRPVAGPGRASSTGVADRGRRACECRRCLGDAWTTWTSKWRRGLRGRSPRRRTIPMSICSTSAPQLESAALREQWVSPRLLVPGRLSGLARRVGPSSTGPMRLSRPLPLNLFDDPWPSRSAEPRRESAARPPRGAAIAIQKCPRCQAMKRPHHVRSAGTTR